VVNYRRNKPGNPDDCFFLTMVTASRAPWIAELQSYDLLLSEMKRLAHLLRFRFKAWVILPEHLHWLLQPKENDYSDIVSAFKRGAGAELKRIGVLARGGKMWQHRFWEETIRNDQHYARCVEYIHYNPVKHGLVSSPGAWRYSSFRSHVKRGLYPADWAAGENIRISGAEFD
jgi:putative transposase